MQRKQLLMVAAVGALAAQAHAAVVTWDNSAGSGDRSWFNSTNWDTNAVPTQAASSDVKINNALLSSSGNPVVINDVSAASFRQLDIGVGVGEAGFLSIQSDVTNNTTNSHTIGAAGSGTVTHSAGTVAVARSITLGSTSGTGTWNATGGTLNQAGFGFNVGLGGTGSLSASNSAVMNVLGGLSVAVNTGSTGSVSVGGTATLNYGNSQLQIGGLGIGQFQQTGGTVQGRDLVLGVSAGSTGSYTLSGGSLAQSINNLTIGQAGSGTFTQTGGAVTGGYNFILGASAGSVGSYELSGTGTLARSDGRTIIVGDQGDGTFTLKRDPAVTSVTIGGATGSLTVRNTAGATGVFQGYGKVALANLLTNNGRVIANGDGTDRDLNLASFSQNGSGNLHGIANTIENPITGGTNGWFAVNHGRLQLNVVRTSTVGTVSSNWGEASGDATIDLVNSVRLNFTNHAGQGAGSTATLNLLAKDRSDVGTAPVDVEFIGIWSVSIASINGAGPDGSFGTPGDAPRVNFTFRYDDALAGAETPALYRYTGSSWNLVSSSLDGTNKLITSTDNILAEGLNTMFAVGVPVPEPTTLGLLSLAALPLLRRRGR